MTEKIVCVLKELLCYSARSSHYHRTYAIIFLRSFDWCVTNSYVILQILSMYLKDVKRTVVRADKK